VIIPTTIADSQRVLDHLRTSICFYRVSSHFRSLFIRPMSNFFNMYEFMTMAAQYAEKSSGALSQIHTLRFTFACHLAHETRDENVFGTGGEILRGLKVCEMT
jgi:F-box protein 39